MKCNTEAQLQLFRQTHKEKSIFSKNMELKYFVSGSGKDTLLLLPGGLGVGESLFQYILEFEKRYKVIAPSIPKASTISDIVEGIKSIIDAEGVQSFSIMGQSFGGIIAQELICRYQEMINKVILSHTSTVSNSLEKDSITNYRSKLIKAIKLVKLLPMPLFRYIIKKRIPTIIAPMKAEDKPFWNSYFSELINVKTKEDEILSYMSMLDFVENYCYSPSHFARWKGKLLILESETDKAFDNLQKKALKDLFPGAAIHTFKASGHLTIITDQEEFMKVMKAFLED